MSFIPHAIADTAPTSAVANQFNLMSFLPMIVIFVLFWLLLIRPQQKKAKEHAKMLSELQKGDEVLCTNGIIGKINKVNEKFVLLEIANNVVITIQKSAVGNKVEKSILN